MDLARAAGRGRSHRHRREARAIALEAVFDPGKLPGPLARGAVLLRRQAAPLRALGLRRRVPDRGWGVVVGDELEGERGEKGGEGKGVKSCGFFFLWFFRFSAFRSIVLQLFKKTALVHGTRERADREEGERD